MNGYQYLVQRNRLMVGLEDAVRKLGVQHCISQCAELLEAGVPGLHFYTMNQAGLTSTIWQRLGI